MWWVRNNDKNIGAAERSFGRNKIQLSVGGKSRTHV